MRISLKISLAFSIAIVSIAFLGYVMIYQLNTISEPFNQEIPKTLVQIQKTSILDEDAQLMKYYDEVLTQSARNYAFTQDKKWEERYKIADPALDLIIKDAIKHGDAKDVEFFSSVNSANLALLKMEYASLDLVDQGHTADAIKILESKEYWDQKNIYQQGLVNYVARQGSAYNQALTIHTQELDKVTTNTLDLIKNETHLFSIIIPVMIILSIIVGFFIVHNISKPISNLKAVTEKISNGNFDTRVNVTGNDEISNLSMQVNTMAEKLGEYRKHLVKTERLAAIGETAARLGHDLRNPLSVIKMNLDVMKLKSKDGVPDQASQERYGIINKAILRMSYQIENVLDFIRAKPLEFDNHSLAEIINEVSEKIEKPNSIKINLPQNDVKIQCDSKRLEIVFINLITNAIQAIGKDGEITIKITDDKINAYISVEDSGPGIPNDILPKIFNPLFTTKQTGTGLGLISCKNIIHEHNGSINVKNNPTTFTVTIPMNNDTSSAIQEQNGEQKIVDENSFSLKEKITKSLKIPNVRGAKN